MSQPISKKNGKISIGKICQQFQMKQSSKVMEKGTGYENATPTPMVVLGSVPVSPHPHSAQAPADDKKFGPRPKVIRAKDRKSLALSPKPRELAIEFVRSRPNDPLTPIIINDNTVRLEEVNDGNKSHRVFKLVDADDETLMINIEGFHKTLL